jgi:hypothetical protein
MGVDIPPPETAEQHRHDADEGGPRERISPMMTFGRKRSLVNVLSRPKAVI